MPDVIVPIVLAGGLDTKTDDKSVGSDHLLVLENGVFETPKKIKPRFGSTNLGDSIIGGGNITLATGVASNLNTDQLVEFADNKVYGYSAAKLGFIDIGSGYPTTAKNSTIVDSYNLENSQNCDMATVGNYEIYTYDVSSLSSGAINGVQFLIKDRVTNAILYQSAFVSSPLSSRPRVSKVLAWGSFAYQIKTGAEIGAQPITISKIDPSSTSPVVATATITRSGLSIQDIFDAMITPLGLMVVYYTTSNNIQIKLYDANLTLLNTANIDITAITGARNGLALAHDTASGNTFIFWATTNNGYWTVLDAAFAVVLPLTIINAANPWGGGNTTFHRVSALLTSSDRVTAIFSSTNDGANAGFPDLLSKFTVNSAAVIFTDYTFCNTGELVSKICAYAGRFYVVLGYANTGASGQNTFYLNEVTPGTADDVNTLGNAARFLIGNAGTANYTEAICPVPELSLIGSSLIVALQSISSLSLKLSVSIYAVTKEEFNFLDAAHSSIATVPDTNFLVSGAGPIMIDDFASEEEFNVFPEPPAVSDGGPTVIGVPVGTFQYYAVYEWIDTNGQIHQSSPSLPSTIVISVANSIVNINYYSLLNTTKNNVTIVFYRTLANGVTPYRLTNGTHVLNPQPRTSSASILTAVDTATDTGAFGIDTHEILYTTGGILPNDPAPSCSFQWLYKNRVMLGGLDDGNQIWYSKTRVAGEPIKFSAFFFTQVDIAGGDVTAGGTLDDKCVFFKKNKIFYMYGDGPNDAGGGGQFSVPQEVSSPTGCAYPKSVVQMPLGLMFKSEKGIELLDRGLNVQFIGSPVAAFNQYNVTAAIHLATVNQVRFYLDNGMALMFDYFVGQWSTFTNMSAVGSALYQNQASYVGANGVLHQENPNSYLDDGVTPVGLTIGLPWLKLSGLQGFQRAKQFLLLMDRNSANSITVQVAYDYESVYYQLPFQWTPVAGDEPDQVRLFLNRQKCEAIKLLISDNATATTGQGFSLSEVALLASVKRGMFKVPSTKSVGTTP